ncbi:hypothetical protein Glove_352g63 [Diversispora epigaea]|uniref:BTB domain-containing protein n=1 Tax=Diversispora epigaea TaxID=1348612 RepID=A0A397HCQ6_9GLOM|nr:hypothetical protein Glove_352g63 [Diversispora epigaea]
MTEILIHALSKDFGSLFKSGDYCDFNIKVGEDGHFTAHSLILRTRSSFFREKLRHNPITNLSLPEIKPTVFKSILKYIYTGRIDISNYDVDHILSILKFSDELGLADLCDYLQKYFINSEELTIKNFNSVQRIAQKNNHFKKLNGYCLLLFKKNPSIIFNAVDFLSFEYHELYYYYSNFYELYKPDELWDNLLKWGNEFSELFELYRNFRKDYKRIYRIY